MVVVRADGNCAPVAGAVVDIWHANAAGKYSDVGSEGTSGKKYLRGLQVSDANGQVKFTTIFPGWYQGRAVHIHFKVRDLRRHEPDVRVHLAAVLRARRRRARSTAPACTPRAATRRRRTRRTASTAATARSSSSRSTPDGNGGYAGTFVVGVSGLPSVDGHAAPTHGHEHRRRRDRLDALPAHEDRPAHPARVEHADRVRRRHRAPVALGHDDRAQDRAASRPARAPSSCASRCARPAARRG